MMARWAGVSALMSGARMLCGAASGKVSAEDEAGRLAAKRCPATNEIIASKAMPATIQGRLTWPRCDSAGGAAAFAGSPQRWQYRAPAMSSVLHETQRLPARAAPHSEQNLPD